MKGLLILLQSVCEHRVQPGCFLSCLGTLKIDCIFQVFAGNPLVQLVGGFHTEETFYCQTFKGCGREKCRIAFAQQPQELVT